MHAVQAKVWPQLGNYTLTLTTLASDLQNATKGTLTRRYPLEREVWHCGWSVAVQCRSMPH